MTYKVCRLFLKGQNYYYKKPCTRLSKQCSSYEIMFNPLPPTQQNIIGGQRDGK